MCVVSMVMDHYTDKWKVYGREWAQPIGGYSYVSIPQVPSDAEIDEFRKLLERAREYDKKNNEPDCEMESKRQILLDIAAKFGVDISFVNES